MVPIKLEYPHVISGSDTWGSSVPLHHDILNVTLPNLQYSLNNMTLLGIDFCSPNYVRIFMSNKTYDYQLTCPHLVLESDYDIKGILVSEAIEGHGTNKIDYYDHLLKFHGEYEKYLDKDSKLHIHLTGYDLDIEIKGKVEYEFRKLFSGDDIKSAAINNFANENWQSVNEVYSKPIIEALMSDFFINLNGYLKGVPVEKFISYYE